MLVVLVVVVLVALMTLIDMVSLLAVAGTLSLSVAVALNNRISGEFETAANAVNVQLSLTVLDMAHMGIEFPVSGEVTLKKSYV